MNIDSKKLEKKISFLDYINFIDNEKDNKIYFLLSNGIMIYDLSTNNRNRIEFNCPGPYKKLILVDDYILILSLKQFLSKCNHQLFISIFDKTLKSLRSYNDNTIVLFNYFEYNHNTTDYFIPISENLFLLEEEFYNINIVEFRIKGKEKLLQSCKEKEIETENGEIEYEFNTHYDDGDIKLLDEEINIGDEELIDYIYKEHILSIKEEEEKNYHPYYSFYVLNNDLLGIIGKNIYIYNISSLNPIIKFEIPFNAFKQTLSWPNKWDGLWAIVKYQEESDKYKLYLGNNKKMTFLSST